MKYNHTSRANVWHYLVLTFNGMTERVYVDGVEDNMQMMTLSSAINGAKFIIGASDEGENYNGYMVSLKMYDYALTGNEIEKQMRLTRPIK